MNIQTTTKHEKAKDLPVAWSNELNMQQTFIGFDLSNSAGDFTIYVEIIEGRIINDGLLIEKECQRVA